MEQEHTAADHSPTTDKSRACQLEKELRNLRVAMRRIERELSATRVREREAQHLALHDMLTELPNRRFFRQRLEQALDASRSTRPRLALLYVDLNRFKAVNDELGHAMGDLLLKKCAYRLKHSMRRGDIICRLGGDEFGCLLKDVNDRRQVGRIAANAFRVLNRPTKLGKASVTIAASIGIALCPRDGMTPETLIQHADSAMYFAKKHGTPFAFYRERAVTRVVPYLSLTA